MSSNPDEFEVEPAPAPEMPEATYVVETTEELIAVLKQLVQSHVSDIFITANKNISIRKVGEVKHTSSKAPGEEVLIEFLNRCGDVQIEGLLTDQKQNPEGQIDGAITSDGQRFRYNFFRALDHATMRQTVKISLRPLNDNIPNPADLMIPNRLIDELDRLQQGLVLICGKTGQGKSTSLASILKHRADKFYEHIITLEQPIEYLVRSDRSVVSQREVGVSTVSFASGLRAALRQNPDTILVGEIRDRETAEIALSAAESGHIVFGTLHTSNAVQSVERFINIFPTDQQNQVWNVLSTALKAIVCQILVKNMHGARVAVREILIVNNNVAAYVKNHDLNGVRRAMESGFQDYGMVNWIKAAEQLYRTGEISEDMRKSIEAMGT